MTPPPQAEEMPHLRRAEQDRHPAEDGRLGQWVQAVVRHWRARGVGEPDLSALFGDLLHGLVTARTRGAGTEQLVAVGPDAVADQLLATRTSSEPAAHTRRRR